VATLDNYDQNIGMGMVGELKDPQNSLQFLEFVEDKMNVSCIKHSEISKDKIKKVAVLGGSGSVAISAAKGAGAGNIGNYDNCSFNAEGTGTYRGNENSNPTLGKKGELHEEKEVQISVTFNKHIESKLLKTLFEHHPYEEVAFEVATLDNYDQNIGMGMVGELKDSQDTMKFLTFVKEKMNVSSMKHSEISKDRIKKVAVLGGSGSFAISAAKRAGADILITADLKYHDFFSAENEIILADIGHYESEQFTKNFLVEYLSNKITNFAIVLSTTNTNPVKFL
jgi:putative NIF3 family GTP cyclohydrolase 1 type 2